MVCWNFKILYLSVTHRMLQIYLTGTGYSIHKSDIALQQLRSLSKIQQPPLSMLWNPILGIHCLMHITSGGYSALLHHFQPNPVNTDFYQYADCQLLMVPNWLSVLPIDKKNGNINRKWVRIRQKN